MPDKIHQPIIISPKEWEEFITIQFALDKEKRLGLHCYNDLVRPVYDFLHIQLPERLEDNFTNGQVAENEGKDWIKVDDPQPGCVAVMRGRKDPATGQWIFHLGIVTPDLQVLHIARNMQVITSSLSACRSMIHGYYVYAPGQGDYLPVGDGAIGKIIAGVIMVVVGAVMTVMSGGTASPLAAGLMKFGAGMILSGVIEGVMTLIAPSAKQQKGPTGDSSTYSWDGITNNFRQGGNKAWIFGRVRVGGQIITEKTWIDADNKEFLDILICSSGGRITRFSDVEINDTTIDSYTGCSMFFRPGDDEQQPIEMFNKIYLQYPSSIKFSENWVEFESKGEIEGIRFVTTAPNGLYKIQNDGDVDPRSVVYRIQYKNTTTITDWADIPTGDTTWGTANPYYNRITGAFTGSANPYTLTDDGGGFDDQFVTGREFVLVLGATTYYCTQTGTPGETSFTFNCFTNAGRTTAKTGSLANGAYKIYTDDLHYDISRTSGNWRLIDSVPMAHGFTLDVDRTAIKFTVSIDNSNVSYMALQVWYRPEGGTWVMHDTFSAGAVGTYLSDPPPVGHQSRNYVISGLPVGKYQVVVTWVNETDILPNSWSPPSTKTIENFSISNIYMDDTYVPGTFTITADADLPQTAIAKSCEVGGLARDSYTFRICRTTVEASGIRRQDGIYLRSYSEVIDRNLSYPNHALLGIRAMATDRLYGSRPTITAIATGEPLSVPAATTTTTIVYVEGLPAVVEYDLVNGVSVYGMTRWVVDCLLPAQTTAGEYYWMVFLKEDGYSQPDRMLTRPFTRIHAWRTYGGTRTEIWVQNTETLGDGESVMLFPEADAPVDNLAWAVTKMLINGSRGRIPSTRIDWDSFADFNIWCEGNNYKFNAAIDFTTDLWSAAIQAAAMGKGQIYVAGGKFRIVIDKPYTGLLPLFSEGNVKNVSMDFIPRQERANILSSSFLDADNRYSETPFCRDDVQGEEFPWVEEMPLMIGVTSSTHANDLLDYELRRNRYLDQTITFDAGIDTLSLELGGVFWFSAWEHDFYSSGRIAACDNGTVTLDQAFTPETGVSYRLTVWFEDGSLQWTGTFASEEETSTIANAFPGVTMTEYYKYPYMFGKVSEERNLFRCRSIKRIPETMEATITGIEYNEEVYV